MSPWWRLTQWLTEHLTPSEPWNVQENRRLWDEYASKRGRAGYPGDEWGTPAAVDALVEEWIDPYVSPTTLAAEIGVGAGRIAMRIAPKVRHLTGCDV